MERDVHPDSNYDIIEIINHLQDPEWRGVKKEGNHDLIVFSWERVRRGDIYTEFDGSDVAPKGG